jgi:drug/metabolite transporter (DMT)-like permease
VPENSRTSGLALIVLTLLSWASVPLFLRHFSANLHLDPFSANGWRYGISALFWLPFLIFLFRAGKLPRELFRAAIVPTAFNILGQTTFAIGPALLEPGFFSFVFRVQIVFVTLGAYFLFPGERETLRRPRYWIGIALVVIGSVGLVMFKQPDPDHKAVVTGAGIFVALLSGVLFAGYGLSVRYYVSKFPAIHGFGVICNYTAVGMIGVALLVPSLASVIPAGLPPLNPKLPIETFDLWAWVLLIASAFIGIAISHVMYYASLSRLGVAVSVGIIQLQPIFTGIGSMLIFGEKLNAAQWTSGLVGVCGAMLMLSATPKKTDRAVAEAEAE